MFPVEVGLHHCSDRRVEFLLLESLALSALLEVLALLVASVLLELLTDALLAAMAAFAASEAFAAALFDVALSFVAGAEAYILR